MTSGTNGVDGGHLLALIERIEKLSEEKQAIADDIKDIFSEAKGAGYDPAIMKKVIAIRKQDKSKREEQEEMIDLYLSALGQLDGTPLGAAAVSREFGARQ